MRTRAAPLELSSVASSAHFFDSALLLSLLTFSAIVGPDGVDLTRASEDEEGRLLVHDLNPATFASEFETTPMLVDRRPELFDKIAEHNEWK